MWFGVRQIEELPTIKQLFSCSFPKTTNIQTKTFLLAIFCHCNVPSFVKNLVKTDIHTLQLQTHPEKKAFMQLY